ncbi:MAG: hypothetical protein FJ207_10390 [Gemmatimonadetes bacterium]|nr:hypothetical protein [Gemmatimonadota bacterium]
MRRLLPLAAFALLAAPAAVAAQVQLLGGGGLGRPFGDFSDAAGSGWHALVGMQVSVPAIPIALRADGTYHSFAAPTGLPGSSMLAGAASLVVSLPGVGLVPYFLGGIGQYRVSLDQSGVDPVTDNGFHGAFGVNIGAMGFGGFAELRVVNVSQSAGDARFLTATFGLRL